MIKGVKMSKQVYCVYKHTSPSGKSYIGQTNNYKSRCNQHKSKSNGCVAFSNAIKKYGWDNFEHIILEQCSNANSANEREIYWIKHVDSFNNGYNLTPGGNNYMEELWKNPEFKEKMKKSFSIRS